MVIFNDEDERAAWVSFMAAALANPASYMPPAYRADEALEALRARDNLTALEAAETKPAEK